VSAPDGERPQARIRRVATELFAAQGYHAAGVSEISAGVGLGRGALYHHIGSKENVLFEIIDGLVRNALDDGRAAVGALSRPEDQLRALASDLLHSLVRNAAAWQVTVRDTESLSPPRRHAIDSHRAEYEDLWRGVLDEGAESEGWRRVTTVQLKGILGMFHHSYVWLRADGELSVDDVADLLVDVALHGIAQPASSARARRG
jgi:AcrR family transcriptional regulator